MLYYISKDVTIRTGEIADIIHVVVCEKRKLFETPEQAWNRISKDVSDRYLGVVPYRINGWADEMCHKLKYTLTIGVND